MTAVDLISPCGSMALPIGITGEDFARRPFPTTSIGPIIASYLTERPSELKECRPQCIWPQFGFACGTKSWQSGCCDGNGVCFWSRHLGRFRTLHCSCRQTCRDKPIAKWKADAFTVLRVLTLRRPINYGHQQEQTLQQLEHERHLHE